MTIDAVQKYYRQLLSRLEALDEAKCPVVIIHLGVAENAECIRLEKSAYNEADFRIPDQNGICLLKTCIDEDCDLGERKDTSLDIEALFHCLTAKHGKIEISSDPGRYICNYCYYLSLKACMQVNLKHGDDSHTRHALFVHVPMFNHISFEEQLTLVKEIIFFMKKGTSFQADGWHL